MTGAQNGIEYFVAFVLGSGVTLVIEATKSRVAREGMRLDAQEREADRAASRSARLEDERNQRVREHFSRQLEWLLAWQELCSNVMESIENIGMADFLSRLADSEEDAGSRQIPAFVRRLRRLELLSVRIENAEVSRLARVFVGEAIVFRRKWTVGDESIDQTLDGLVELFPTLNALAGSEIQRLSALETDANSR